MYIETLSHKIRNCTLCGSSSPSTYIWYKKICPTITDYIVFSLSTVQRNNPWRNIFIQCWGIKIHFFLSQYNHWLSSIILLYYCWKTQHKKWNSMPPVESHHKDMPTSINEITHEQEHGFSNEIDRKNWYYAYEIRSTNNIYDIQGVNNTHDVCGDTYVLMEMGWNWFLSFDYIFLTILPNDIVFLNTIQIDYNFFNIAKSKYPLIRASHTSIIRLGSLVSNIVSSIIFKKWHNLQSPC